MALPSSIETERNRYLMELVRNASEPIIDWPAPNRDDVVLIGKVVMIYSYIDFNLRRMIELLDHAKTLPPAWLGKTAKMHLSVIETILETAPDIAPNNALALRRIKEFRANCGICWLILRSRDSLRKTRSSSSPRMRPTTGGSWALSRIPASS